MPTRPCDSFVSHANSVRLTVASNVQPMPPALTAAWQDLLSDGQREVTADDLLPLQMLLLDVADPDLCTLDRADILHINGKLVLRIVAFASDTQTQRFDFLVDCTSTGQFIESFSCESPAAHYEALLTHAHIALNTAVWKDADKHKLPAYCIAGRFSFTPLQNL